MIQIDIDMPKDCFYCPMLQSYVTFGGFSGGKRSYCSISKKEIYDLFKRHKSCPLIEIKEGEQK